MTKIFKGFISKQKSIIAYIDDTAVGCAGLKRYSEEDVEIKRVWVNPENRGQHIALDMMGRLHIVKHLSFVYYSD